MQLSKAVTETEILQEDDDPTNGRVTSRWRVSDIECAQS